jgi:hypothetical protein
VRRWALLVAAAGVALGSPSARAQDGEATPAVLVRVEAPWLRPPRGGALVWAVYDARRDPPAPSPRPRLDRLREAYLGADFLSCLGALRRRAFDLAALTRAGRQDDGAAVAVLGAGCLLGADDVAGARALIDRALGYGLPVVDALDEVAPPVQRLVEERRLAFAERPAHDVRVTSEPPGASVAVDGRRACASTPCELRLRQGEHLLRLERFAHRPRDVAVTIRDDAPRSYALDRASPAELMRQLGRRSRAGDLVAEPGLLEALSRTLGGPLLALARADTDPSVAVYDANLARIVSRVNAEAEDALDAALASALAAWRREVDPPLYLEPWLWVGVGAVVLAGVGTALAVALQPPTRYVIDP